MPVPRVYLPQPLEVGSTVTLDDRAAKHVARVLRMRPGDALVLFNGDGGEREARLETLGRRVRARVERSLLRQRESTLPVTLALGISRGERMDYAIQKAVELGAAALQPLLTARCVVRLEPERAARRLRHWEGVMVGACEQCGRNRLPELGAPLLLEDWLAASGRYALRLMLEPRGAQRLGDLTPPQGSVALLVGPEGGLTEGEHHAAAAHGFHGLRLGPRVLRTETAGVAALAALQAVWGDLA
ncbi:MAG: 16S rRNA (uracil(1498)-N(3))-methyltransferase [Gammaproteobacteria bacterium]|nr:16S rRNA (uracil(1498)-N(3))-methyltransferase [Gammaproteobacteria bacterium]NIR60555.1 16S rRNA (uracil(1498)-N(3))-methyltransferase [Gammaproteobacteria bacterium]